MGWLALKPSDQSCNPNGDRLSLMVLVIVWLASRAVLWVYYNPVTSPDSGTYQRLADQISRMDFSLYNGQRTPVYPLLILFVNNDYFLLWLVQSVMGLATAWLLYLLVRAHTKGSVWPLAAGLMSLLSLNLMFFEPMVHTETASAFLFALLGYLFVKYIHGDRGGWAAAMLGVTAAALTLTRPQYAVVTLVLPIATLMFKPTQALRASLLVLILSVAPVLGWMSFNKMTVDHFALTTLLGYNLTNHSGSFMEYAPDEYAQFRDIYLKYRDMKMEQTGSHHMTVFWARKELLSTTNLTEVELSTKLQELSVKLISQHPWLYLKSVAKAWVSFWTVPNYWNLKSLRSPNLAETMKWTWSIQQQIIRALNVLFILSAVTFFIITLRNSPRSVHQAWIPLALSGMVLAVSIVQALVEYGDNSRYYIPNQPIVIAVVIMAVATYFGRPGGGARSHGRQNL